MAKPSIIEVPDAAVHDPAEYKRVLELLKEPDAVLNTTEIATWIRRPRLYVINRLGKHPAFPRPIPHSDTRGAQALYLAGDLVAWARRGNV
jgi:hypothetical protein